MKTPNYRHFFFFHFRFIRPFVNKWCRNKKKKLNARPKGKMAGSVTVRETFWGELSTSAACDGYIYNPLRRFLPAEALTVSNYSDSRKLIMAGATGLLMFIINNARRADRPETVPIRQQRKSTGKFKILRCRMLLIECRQLIRSNINTFVRL